MTNTCISFFSNMTSYNQMPHGGIKDVSEECFQQTPLEFEGEDQWVVYRSHKPRKQQTNH